MCVRVGPCELVSTCVRACVGGAGVSGGAKCASMSNTILDVLWCLQSESICCCGGGGVYLVDCLACAAFRFGSHASWNYRKVVAIMQRLLGTHRLPPPPPLPLFSLHVLPPALDPLLLLSFSGVFSSRAVPLL